MKSSTWRWRSVSGRESPVLGMPATVTRSCVRGKHSFDFALTGERVFDQGTGGDSEATAGERSVESTRISVSPGWFDLIVHLDKEQPMAAVLPLDARSYELPPLTRRVSGNRQRYPRA